ncbi:MAG TPA: long-chain fatty acid--CoA ligase [Candidatus Saccharimonadales bacterium]|nr:long-chain fatty acid--CoA ligase [Candidatus Saccharimonadales bacterium]
MNAQPTPATLADIFFQIVDRNQSRVMLYEQGSEWHAISSSDLYRRVMGVVQALRNQGIGHGDRVAILSENRPEWAIADFAILLLGGVTVPIYATLTGDQISFLLHHSGARTAFVSTEAQLAKLRSIQSQTFVECIILMDQPTPQSGALSMAALMEAGPKQRHPELDALSKAIHPDDLATLIYTSGTTGVPKGAMLTHGNIASNLSLSLQEFDFSLGSDLAVSFLPLSHITARHVDFAVLYRGVTVAYCPFIEDMPKTLRQLHPTIFVAVPRVYEKIHNQVQRSVARGFKRTVYRWAMSVGRTHVDTVLAGKRPSSIAWKLANRLFFSKVRAAMGGSVRIFISGGAPLGKELAEWYAQIGILIHEGYGLTETSPVIAVNSPRAHRLGSVGIPLSNIEVRIADDGELLVRGPSVFKGYWNMPEETAAAFDGDWFKTGDIAHLDPQGFLSITDRKKDLIKTSGGKFIAPQPIENSLKSNRFIGEAAILGDRRRFPAVVIVPAFAALEDWATESGITFRSRQELVGNPRIQSLYEGIVAQVNNNLARYERLKKVLVIPEELSIENGTLTPTLKLRRRHVEARYKEQIERLYSDSTTADIAHTA